MFFLTIVLTVALMVAANALFVAAEFATVGSRKTRVNRMAARGDRFARMLLPIMEDSRRLDNYIAACQLGITASSLVLGAYGQNTVAAALAPLLIRLGALAAPAAESISATGILIFFTVLQVVFGELFPKSLAVQFREDVARATVLPVRWARVLLAPFIWFFNGSGNIILRLIGAGGHHEHSEVHSPQEIELLVSDSYEGGLLDDEERQMLRNAFRMRDLVARQVMTPRTRMAAAPTGSSVHDLLELATAKGVSRIPLYRESLDQLVGFVHVKDVFKLHVQQDANLAQILRELIYVPETLSINEVWRTLNVSRQYLAIVFDEYGGTAGLVTYEDLIEEIFGELQDEFDDESALIAADEQGRLYLSAELLVTDVNEYLELDLPDDESDSLGGLVFSCLGRLPVVGDEVLLDAATDAALESATFEGDEGAPAARRSVRVRVEAMDGRTITEVSLQLPERPTGPIGEWEVVARE